MAEGRGFQPVRILVNYWEVPPASLGKYCDDLVRRGLRQVTSFVPWHLFESDISHSLHRFLLAASERKIRVTLILTPEIGVHYKFSGLPKDLVTDKSQWARDAQGRPFMQGLPPNFFALPSLASPEFLKRFYGFLSRFSVFVSDLIRMHRLDTKTLELMITGSFWKYYRASKDAALSPFGGIAADHCNPAVLQYRKNLDIWYSREEFSEENDSTPRRWKSKQMDCINQRHFIQESEDVFRYRCLEVLSRNAIPVKILPAELFTPEADPSMLYSDFLQLMSAGNADFFRYSLLLDRMASRSAQVSKIAAQPYLRWTAIGGFRTLSDPEKQFLILKSLLLMGGRGGGVMMDEQQWFALSAGFRSRVESIGKLFSEGRLALKCRALYFAPHLWSRAGTLWDELSQRLGAGAQLISSVDYLEEQNDARLAIVDSSVIINRALLRFLLNWCRPGRILALPRSSLFTEAAKRLLEDEIQLSRQRFEIALGIPYTMVTLGHGQLIVYDAPETSSAAVEAAESWKTESWRKFLDSLLAIADIEEICRLSDPKLKAIALLRRAGHGSGVGLFVLNDTHQPITVELSFPREVTISDFANFLIPVSRPMHPSAAEGRSEPGKQFSLMVPPCGVLPLALEGIAMKDQEFQDALRISDLTRQSADEAALSSLPGLESGHDFSVELGSP